MQSRANDQEEYRATNETGRNISWPSTMKLTLYAFKEHQQQRGLTENWTEDWREEGDFPCSQQAAQHGAYFES